MFYNITIKNLPKEVNEAAIEARELYDMWQEIKTKRENIEALRGSFNGDMRLNDGISSKISDMEKRESYYKQRYFEADTDLTALLLELDGASNTVIKEFYRIGIEAKITA